MFNIPITCQIPHVNTNNDKSCPICTTNIHNSSGYTRGTVQMWYDRIHAYLQLIRLKEGKAKNTGNVIRFARRTSIQTPDKLTMEELKDGLRYCRIRKAELRNQAKGLRKVHLRDCLINAQTKKQSKRKKRNCRTSLEALNCWKQSTIQDNSTRTSKWNRRNIND